MKTFTVIGMRTLVLRSEFDIVTTSPEKAQLMYNLVGEVLLNADYGNGIDDTTVRKLLQQKAAENNLYYNELVVAYRNMRANVEVEDSGPFVANVAIDIKDKN
jgi:hypothetical protein